MIISSVEVIPVRLPLREPFVVSYATYPDTLSVIVRIRTEDGTEGWEKRLPTQMSLAKLGVEPQKLCAAISHRF